MLVGPISAVGGATGASAVTRTASPAGAGDFSKILADVVSDAANSVKAGEQTAIAGIEGKASVQQVVESVMSAEQALQTAIAVRDKLISAYTEISRMAI